MKDEPCSARLPLIPVFYFLICFHIEDNVQFRSGGINSGLGVWVFQFFVHLCFQFSFFVHLICVFNFCSLVFQFFFRMSYNQCYGAAIEIFISNILHFTKLLLLEFWWLKYHAQILEGE